MKDSGLIRSMDELGRVVIPIELREKFGIKKKDPIEIFVASSNIILRKFEPNCIFCGKPKELIEFKDKLVCKKCLLKIKANQNLKK